MSLKEYQSKRDFEKTREPDGKFEAGKFKAVPKREGLAFVIQRHQASHLHYDFRLEYGGVLKSWAVPKGPSTRLGDKRLAMATEDHPLEYAGFEGSIPKGEYGAGEVEIWDHGTWLPTQPLSSVKSALKAGNLKFELKGKKLSGRWALIKMKNAKGDAWLLLKEKDPTVAKNPVSKVRPASAHQKNGSKTKSRLAHSTALTHPDKIYYPEAHISKKDLADFYERVAKWMLPHISKRPLMFLRCPDGRNREGFFQKNWNSTLPSSIKKIDVLTEGEHSSLLMIDSVEGIYALAQAGVLEVHTWGTHAKNIEKPDQFVFDIDPHENIAWEKVAETAFLIRSELKKYKIQSFLKATGGKGLHVVAPIVPAFSWELGKKFCEALCEDIAAKNPGRYLTSMAKAKRKDRIFLDYFRNGRGATAIAPFSPRARNNAPIAVPLAWEELDAGMRSDSVHLSEIDRRLSEPYVDPWQDFLKIKQRPRFSK